MGMFAREGDRVAKATLTIGSLVTEGMFDRAMSIGCAFRGVKDFNGADCLKQVFEGLARECVKLSLASQSQTLT